MRIFDISQPIGKGMAIWPGDRKFQSEWTMRIEDGDSCNVSAVTMSVHTGTHVDAPFHFDIGGTAMADFPLEPFIGPARVVEYQGPEPLSAEELEGFRFEELERLLIKTRASSIPSHQFEREFVHLTEDGAEYLGKCHLKLFGTDAPSVDGFASSSMSVHKTLLRYQIAILEGVRLAEVSPGDYELIALPLRLTGLDGSPVRAILRQC